MEALGIEGNLEKLLSSAYDSVSKTIGTLATLMKEGEPNPNQMPEQDQGIWRLELLAP